MNYLICHVGPQTFTMLLGIILQSLHKEGAVLQDFVYFYSHHLAFMTEISITLPELKITEENTGLTYLLICVAKAYLIKEVSAERVYITTSRNTVELG